MSISNSLEESKSLFKALAQIERLLYKVKNDSGENTPVSGFENEDGASIREACKLIEQNTFNIRLHDAADQLHPSHPNDSSSEAWKIDVLNKYNANLARARGETDPVAAGNMYVKCGLYGEAFSAYAKSDHYPLLGSHLQILQENWSFVISTLSKLFLVNKTRMDNELLENLALSYWCTEEYGNCLAILLHLNPTKGDEFSKKRGGTWLNHKNLLTMLAICALIQFDTSMLQFFQSSERLVSFFGLSDLLKSFSDLDIPQFWATFETHCEMPPFAPKVNAGALQLLKDQLHQRWLYIYNKVPLKKTLDVFGYKNTKYTEFDCIDDLSRWQSPYKVDLVKNCVQLADISENSLALADRLVYEYKRDSLLLLWNDQRH